MKTNIKSKRNLLVLFVVLALAFIFVISFVHNQNQNYQIPPKVYSQINGFQPYFLQTEHNLPNNYKVDKKSTHYENNILFFTLKSPDSQSITVSQQPIPQEFSAKGGNFVGKETIDTKNGKATISYVGNRTSAFMITNDHKTLVILSSDQSIETDTIHSILSNLVAI